MEYDSEIEDSDENEIDNIEEDIVEDDIQEIDSEEDYMPSSESESETELARKVAPPPAKRPRRYCYCLKRFRFFNMYSHQKYTERCSSPPLFKRILDKKLTMVGTL
jgi:hypothetical protein